jgi:hypothetical protein
MLDIVSAFREMSTKTGQAQDGILLSMADLGETTPELYDVVGGLVRVPTYQEVLGNSREVRRVHGCWDNLTAT